MDIRNVSAKEETSILECWRHSDGRARAAGTEHQIDGLIGGTSGTRYIFPAPRERKAVFKGPAYQDCTARGRCPFRNADPRIVRHIRVLEVGLDDPTFFVIGINDVVNAAIVLQRRGNVWNAVCL